MLPLLAELRRVTTSAQSGAEGVSIHTVLAVYIQAVRELRAVAREARGTVVRSAAVVSEAREFVRRRRRRAQKSAGR